MTITPEQLAGELLLASETIDQAASVAVRGSAAQIAQDQRAEIKRRTGRTAETISAVGPDGEPMAPGDLEAQIGADSFVGRLLETGTVDTAPQPWAFQTVDRRAAGLEDQLGRIVAGLL